MNRPLTRLVVLIILCIVPIACSTIEQQYFKIIETNTKTVEHCKLIGSFTESADPGRIFQSVEAERCKYEVLKQAAKAGATHVVWIFKGKTGAGLQAYKCEP